MEGERSEEDPTLPPSLLSISGLLLFLSSSPHSRDSYDSLPPFIGFFAVFLPPRPFSQGMEILILRNTVAGLR